MNLDLAIIELQRSREPVFPARCDDIFLWSSIAIKAMAIAYESKLPEPIFHVYEQKDEVDGSVSIGRVTEVTAYE